MASIDITKAGEFIIKHGVTGFSIVLSLALWMKVERLENDYKDCMNDRIIDSQRGNSNTNRPVATLQKEITLNSVKKEEDKHA